MTHTERFAEACAEMMLAQYAFHQWCERDRIKRGTTTHEPCEESMALWSAFWKAEERARDLLDMYLATREVTKQDLADVRGDEAMEARRA